MLYENFSSVCINMFNEISIEVKYTEFRKNPYTEVKLSKKALPCHTSNGRTMKEPINP